MRDNANSEFENYCASPTKIALLQCFSDLDQITAVVFRFGLGQCQPEAVFSIFRLAHLIFIVLIFFFFFFISEKKNSVYKPLYFFLLNSKMPFTR